MPKINPSILRPKGRSMLRVDTERRLYPRLKRRGLGAAECIKPGCGTDYISSAAARSSGVAIGNQNRARTGTIVWPS